MKNSNLMTSVDLTLTDKKMDNPYHFIYGSNLYGTLFGVFGQFEIETTGDGNVCLVKKIHMDLVNYKGLINIGFSKHTPFIKGRKNIYFGVKGGRREYQKTIKFKDPLVIKKHERLPLVFNRMLYPIKGFEFDIKKRNKRDNNKELKKPIPKTRVFDTEFQYRSGSGYYDSELRPGMLGYNGLSLESIRNTMPFPSPRCHHSKVSLFFA
ncbi:hypothetical protein [Flagellimonas algicola]|uniref:Uncharacterized protein n=1 Tax=Flagellimonas algicola TaxID=2583815 RepID=A0ABY2WR64_9FLAO|nr:hypothetical protein [Allomuricauda algicola]TMU57494.1 hypothetical protein FGG15_08100 [Allomuricauda algicola]